MHKRDENGFTLVEMLVSVSVLAIIAGAAYAVFKTSIDAYHQTEAKILAAQRTRVALDTLATDLKHFQAAPEEPDFVLYTQDMPSESGERDMLSFVTLVRTEPDPFLAQLNAERRQTRTSLTMPPLMSDVQRVAYFVRAEMPSGGTGGNNFQLPNAATETEELALYRVTTTSLNPEVVIGSLMDTGTAPQTDENGEPVYSQIATLVSGIVNFDLKYLGDEGTWYDSWDQEDSNPYAVRVLITVKGEDSRPQSVQTSQLQTGTPPNTMIQTTMVALPQAPPAPEGQGGPPQ